VSWDEDLPELLVKDSEESFQGLSEGESSEESINQSNLKLSCFKLPCSERDTCDESEARIDFCFRRLVVIEGNTRDFSLERSF
jgi:hypothetical protein